MKLVKLFNKLSAVALAASLVVGFASCSTTTDDPFNPNAPLTLEEYVKSEIKKAIENGGAQAKPEDPSKPGKPSGSGSLKESKSLEFHVNADSTNAENTMIFVKYDRSAYGAEEEVKVTDAELNLYINDVKVKTYNEIVFVLDEYGAEITSRGPIEDPKAMKEYKAKLSVGKAVKSGETVKIELVKASVVKVGAASDKITLANLQFALIDTDPSVDYYKELAPNEEQFQNICTLEDLTTGEDTESKPEPTPTPGEEEKPGEKPEPGKTPGEEYEAGNSTVTSIKLVKNEYAAGGALQTQIKIPSELTSLLVGDKVKVAFKGTADREIGNVELMIVDTTEDASYWTALSETKKDTFSTEINFDFEFEITKAPIGTGENSMVLAINGLDSDAPATITCTSFSIEKNADKKPAGGENNAGGEEGGDSVVFDDAISAVELSPNNWDGKDNGIQYHVANASLFPAGIEAGDKYKFEMTGSVTGGPITQKFIIVIDNDTYNPNNVQNYFVNDPDVSGKSAEECLSEGITVTMTFDAAIESSKVVLWIYTEGPRTDYDAETTASKTATIDFSSFKITKVE